MRPPTLSFPRLWLFVPAFACGFLIWINVVRVRHLDYVSNAAGAPAAMNASSPTGYVGGVRHFIAAGKDADSYQWIAQTQQMFAHDEWRVRHVDYDNVPLGRPVFSASLYRWWLGALAEIHHVVSGQPIGVSIERVALFSDPLLQLLLLAGTACFVARRFGALPAALVSLGFAAVFPFAGWFISGQPQQGGMQLAAALWTVLPLLIVGTESALDKSVRRHFFLAGVAGGIGLWLSLGTELPILGGVMIGGLFAAAIARRTGTTMPLPWRAWALGGAITCFIAYVIEFFPAHDPGLRLNVVHPLHGLAWLGLGEILTRADRRLRIGKQPQNRRGLAIIALAVVSVAVPLVFALRAPHEWFASDSSSMRLSAFSDSAIATDLLALIRRDGFSIMVAATLLPVALIAPAIWLVARSADTRVRTAIAIALGPVTVALALAVFHLRWWALLDTVLFTLVIVGAAEAVRMSRRGLGRWIWTWGIALAAVPGAIFLSPSRSGIETVNESELEGLIERDLAHWLAQRAGPGRAAIVASPDLAASLAFKGGLRALGSPYPENRDGLKLSLRIAGSRSQDEAFALIERRQITHIVLASWDPSLERLVELGDKDQKSLVALLHRWLPPRWLQPVPYRMPQVPGFEGQSVVVFEVVELQDNSVALSHLAEYFAETEQPQLATSAAAALERLFPEDLGATIARVQVAAATRDQRTANEAFKVLQSQLTEQAALSLPWDRRVSLAIVLAEAKHYDEAKKQMEQCLAEIDEPRLRSLTTLSLYRSQQLMKGLGLTFSDQRMQELSRSLLPPEMRSTP